MAEEQLFRTALHGFNKDDVITYIDGINRTASENQEWFDKQSKAMAETIKRLNKENKELKEQTANAVSDTDNEEFEEQKAKFAEVIKQLGEKLTQKDDELKKANDRISQLETAGANTSTQMGVDFAAEKDTLVTNLKQACQRLYEEQQENNRLRNELDEANKKNITLTVQVDQLTAQIQAGGQIPIIDNLEVDSLKAKIAELEEKLEQSPDTAILEAKIASLQAQLEAANSSNEEFDEDTEVGKIKNQLLAVQDQASAQIEQLTAQNRQLTSRLTLLQAQANANAQSARASGAGIYAPVNNVNIEEKYNEKIRTLEDQVKRLEADNDKLKLKTNISEEELQILREKARLYDDIKNNVAKIVDEARRKAADMIRDAEISCNETMANGTNVLTQMQRRIHTMQEEIESARKMYNQATLSMASMLNSIGDSISITDNHLISILGTGEDK